jgi:hypothetical protein
VSVLIEDSTQAWVSADVETGELGLDVVGCGVAPSTRIRRVACSITPSSEFASVRCVARSLTHSATGRLSRPGRVLQVLVKVARAKVTISLGFVGLAVGLGLGATTSVSSGTGFVKM